MVFCNYLSIREGLTPCYDLSSWYCYFRRSGYRLPTEAEWEFAARGGIKSRRHTYAGGANPDSVSWNGGNSDGTVRQVGQKNPNELGLYDFSGNVEEWCWDWYGEYERSSQVDPRGPQSGIYRVIRGGSAFDDYQKQKISNHDSSNTDYLYESLGLRPVRWQ